MTDLQVKTSTTNTNETLLSESTTNSVSTLDLTNVQYQDSFKLRSGSMAQLILGVKSMLNRVSVEKETDPYKKVLYPPLRDLANQIVEKFSTLLTYKNQKEHDVREYNLCGYNGQVKPDKYGRYPYVKGVNQNTKYGFANFGYFLKMLKQRAEYLMTRSVPQRYLADKEQGEYFTNLHNDVSEFYKFLSDTIEQKWNETVKNARESGGEVVAQKLEKRHKAMEEHNANRASHVNPQQNGSSTGIGGSSTGFGGSGRQFQSRQRFPQQQNTTGEQSQPSVQVQSNAKRFHTRNASTHQHPQSTRGRVVGTEETRTFPLPKWVKNGNSNTNA